LYRVFTFDGKEEVSILNIGGAIQSIGSIVIIVFIGYILSKKGFFKEGDSGAFSKIVCNLSLPLLMINTLCKNFTRDMLGQMLYGMIIPLASIVISYLISCMFGRWIRDRKRLGIFKVMFVASNTIFIGMPLNQAIFGDESLPYVLIYYLANTVFFWTLGIYLISRDGLGRGSRISFKRLLSPPLAAFIIGLVLVFFNITLPKVLMDVCSYIGNMTTPLSLLFIGMTFNSVKLKDITIDRDTIFVFAGRFIVSPVIIYLLVKVLPIPDLMENVFIVQASLPVMAQAAIISQNYGADYKYAATVITLSTLAGLITIPAWIMLLGII
jgi:auxin efflux carrier (AEC)